MSVAADAPTLLRRDGRPARIALVHEWFDHFYGSERVAAEMLSCFLDGKTIRTSFIQRLPFGSSPRFRHYLPLFPLAIEQFDLSAYDLVSPAATPWPKASSPASINCISLMCTRRCAMPGNCSTTISDDPASIAG